MLPALIRPAPRSQEETSGFPILREDLNCWRLAKCSRAAFLVDGADYFRAFVAACETARRSIYIAGWDINSRVKLLRGLPRAEDEEKYRLGNFLNHLARNRPGLHIHILDWDFAMLYAMEREMLPVVKLGWATHHRVHLVMDDDHPLTASQHQKIVVVDDCLAFSGGLDLTHSRWDTPEHAPTDPLRMTPGGTHYPPFHDVQILVDGDAAACLGELFRQRWIWAKGKRLPKPEPRKDSPWPWGVPVHARDTRMGISLTLPAYKLRKPVRQVERLFRDSIAAAKRYIYIETQYFTSDAVCGFLCESLRRPLGPEIMLAVPFRSPGWLEQGVMDGLRVRVLDRLREADHHGRLRVYYPYVPDLDHGASMHLHSKVMIADDCFLRIGSANLSNRSMGLDSECDLALECIPGDPDGEALREAISGLLHRLLGEHLGVPPGLVAAGLEETGSLIATVEALRNEGRSLRPLESAAPEWVDPDILDHSLLDPEKPMAMDRLIDMFFFDTPEPTRRWRAAYVLPALLLLAFIGLALAWKFGPLAEWLDLDSLTALGRSLRGSPLEPLLVLGALTVGSVLMVPITLMLVAVALLYGPITSFAYAFSGSLLGAIAGYLLGGLLGKDPLRNLAGRRINRLSRAMARQGVLAMALVRNLPVAPFGLVNLIAGASHIHFRDYLLGTALGMLPGVLAITLLGDSLGRLIRQPSWTNVLLALAVIGCILLAAWWLRRRLAQREQEQA